MGSNPSLLHWHPKTSWPEGGAGVVALFLSLPIQVFSSLENSNFGLV